ncbi:MAG TPA: hypothetical protein VG125_12135 [Pirellulales bacterium]|jgi:hypothetical protein|nr:hypothetical protein [Pirellulales bacterium]
MKAKEIHVGGVYLAKVSGDVVPVRVKALRDRYDLKGRCRVEYICTNTRTGREIVVKSPLRFRREVAKASNPGQPTPAQISDNSCRN